MINHSCRLKKNKEFEVVFKERGILKEKLLILKARKNKLKVSKFGFVVSRKVSKKAVDRNKIKRRLRAITEKEIKNIKPGLDIVVIALPEAQKASFKELEATIYNLYKKANIL